MSISSEISRLTQAKADIKTAIENKGVTVPSSAKLDDYPDYIDDIEQGGGGGETVKESDVNFIDFDGTILHSYSASEFLNLTSMPENPTHKGLISQGWNWSLTDAKEQVTEMETCDIGQMYITESGDTEIDVYLASPTRLSPSISVSVNGTISVDWGDETAPDEVTGGSLTTSIEVPHSYSKHGYYTIRITVLSGAFVFLGTSSTPFFHKNNTAMENRVYSSCVKAVRIGTGITSITSYAFNCCHGLEYITIPYGIAIIDQNAFKTCYKLSSVTVPSGVTSLGGNVFYQCYSLSRLSIPLSVTDIGASAFQYCFALTRLALPFNVTAIYNSVFQYCYGLLSISLPPRTTRLSDYSVNYCFSLSSITVPSAVSRIGASVFSSCYGLRKIHLLPSSPPTLSSGNSFNNLSSDCILYVPAESLEAYKTATNWSTHASKMVGE